VSHVDLEEMRALLRAQAAPKSPTSKGAPARSGPGAGASQRQALSPAPAEDTGDLFATLELEAGNPPPFAAPAPPVKRSIFGKRAHAAPSHAAPLLLTDRTSETPLRLDALALSPAATAIQRDFGASAADEGTFAATPFHPDDLADEDLFEAPPQLALASDLAQDNHVAAPVLDTPARLLLHDLAQAIDLEKDRLDAARSDVAAPLVMSTLRRRRGERDYKHLGFANDRH
jgi:hypothetical protein